MRNIHRLTMYLAFLLTACVLQETKQMSADEILRLGAELLYGPPLNDFYLKKIRVIRNGRELTLVADRDYIAKALTYPMYEKRQDSKTKKCLLHHFPKKKPESQSTWYC